MNELFLAFIIDALMASIPALGFALLFNVPPKILPYCAIGGASAHSLRFLLLELGIPIEPATLIAATCLGFLGVYWSKKHLIPRPVFTVASVIPMFPGSYGFTALVGIFELHTLGYSAELLQTVIENGLRTLFIIGALSFGLALPSVLIYRERPIV